MRIGLVLSVSIAIASPVHAATFTPVASFGDNPGALAMYEYAPANLPAGRPLVVVLHGCTQTAAAMEAAGWHKLADDKGFAVVYPEQATANNPVRCFNWAGEYGDTANLERGKGENQSIMSMIDHAIAAHASDPRRVYIVGFSAGAAFASVMLATWPEKFAGGAIMSGLPYRCATTVNEAYQCQNPGKAKDAAAWGELVRTAASSPGARPPVQIWHGTIDTTVQTMNAGELVKQWTNVHGTDATADATETIGKATRTQYKAGDKVVVEEWVITGMGHAIVVGADSSGTCPATTGAYFSDQGVCSTLHAAEFFGLLSPSGGGGGSGSGSGGGGEGGGGGDDDDDAPSKALPGCSLDASGGGAGALIGLALLAVRRRRWR